MEIRWIHSIDVPHTFFPYLDKVLEDCDAVIVSPGMGVSDFKPYGERVIIDCTNYLGLQPAGGYSEGLYLRRLALESGLSLVVPQCEYSPLLHYPNAQAREAPE